MSDVSKNFENSFLEAYKGLNSAQKEAVDTVEGPVLVVAGPGTGKTHILTLRIANILRKTTGTAPENILVLTFTESAARTVRKRLARFTGDEVARKVQIFTFHSFAGHVMSTYPQSFPEYSDRRLMGEVEAVLLWRYVLEHEEVKFMRTPKSPFHYVRDLSSLEDTLTRENLSLAEYEAWIKSQEEEIMASDEYRYKRDSKYGAKGDLNADGQKKLERFDKAREAISLIETFRREKESRDVYGYTDVLRIVVDAVTNDASLRADLQEKYQYVLADEHQDANALQHALLDALAFDEYPNLFIVGDEKQAIFRFQGADSTHFKTFIEHYPRTVVIELTENFRSFQGILNVAHGLLKDLPSSTGGHVELESFRSKDGAAGAGISAAKLALLISPDPLAERDQVATMVEQALAEGVAPHEIAVIAVKNATADLFAAHLRAKGIPTLRAGDVDLEGRPAVRAFLSLMQAVADAGNTPALRDALLAPWWKMSLADRANFMRRYRDYEFHDALLAEFPDVSKHITTLQEDALKLPPLPLISKMLAETGARTYFLGTPDGFEDVPLVRQIITYVEEEVARNPDMSFAEVMDSFTKAREHGFGSIRTSITQQEGKVTVITAHKAKGMEFERVFVVSLTEREWEKGGKGALIPSPFDGTRELEDLVRLLYVAMTRAKNELVLSYPEGTGDGKEVNPTQLLPGGIDVVRPAFDPLPLFHSLTNAPALIQELMCNYLEHEGLSPSAFNEYLESPACFFAKRVLRLREPENQAITIGNAVHAGVAGYLRAKRDQARDHMKEGTGVQQRDEETENEDVRVSAAHAELTRSLARSLLPRNSAFEQLARHARASLDSYLSSELLTREAVAIEEKFSMSRTLDTAKGKKIEVILQGKVDAVFTTDHGECIVDFKTSKSISADKKKFERQLAFYDMLLRENSHDTTSAMIIQIGDEDVREYPVDLTNESRTELRTLLDEVLNELVSGKWRKGEPTEYDALLELFA